MIKQEIKNIDQSKEALRKFGLSVGTVILIAGALFFYFDNSVYRWFIIGGILLIVTGAVYPEALRQVNKGWMSFAVVMGFVMTRIILSLLYFLVLTPIAFIAKLSGKKFITKDFDKGAVTYWEQRGSEEFRQIDYERQF